MERKRIAVLFGGCSNEHSISLQSAQSVMEALEGRHVLIPIGITRQGAWYHYTGPIQSIGDGTWEQDKSCLVPALLSPDRQTSGILEWTQTGLRVLPVDLVFPVLHGKNGEDGTIQGLVEMAGLPLVGCGTLASALCMDKYRAHLLAGLAGVASPRGVLFQKGESADQIRHRAAPLKLPLFIKPVRSGSSLGITKISNFDDLLPAVQAAFEHDDRVLAEENVEGVEIGCAVLDGKPLFFGKIDEIELSDGFFDFTEKYTLKTSKIHMPARIDDEIEARVRKAAAAVWQALDCKGYARIDFFLTPRGEILFNEVNTIPGFTSHSRYPNMMRGAGLAFEDLLDRLIEEALSA